MTKLILVRHGQSRANLEKRFAGHTDVELTENGFMQAKATAEYIKANYNVSKVYASDLVRAFETGRSISDLMDVEIVAEPGLREIFAGKWEGMLFEDIISTFSEDYSVWLNDAGVARCTNGESTAELAERVLAVLEKIAQKHNGEVVAVATHATVIRVTQTVVQTGSLGNMKDVPWVSNASISELEYDGGKWKFGKISYDEHLSDLRSPLPKNV